MPVRPRRLALALLVAALLLSGLTVHPPTARALGAWLPAAPPTELGASDRGGVGALVPLRDGRVLAFGTRLARPGEQARLVAALYDLASDRWSQQSSTGPLDGGNATPTLLSDGRVLLVGGYYNPGLSPGGGRVLATAQIYDPAAGSWLPVAPLATPRGGHTATLLQDGTVLVVGGSVRTSYQAGGTTREAERYDPRTDRWSPAGQLLTGRDRHTATLLADGRVLIVGGRPDILAYGAPAERYDPATNGWIAAGAMVALRGGEHQATRLADGSVLVTGGYTSRPDASSAVNPQAAVERYDPATNRWAAVAPMSSPRNAHSATLLPDGTVLVVSIRVVADHRPHIAPCNPYPGKSCAGATRSSSCTVSTSAAVHSVRRAGSPGAARLAAWYLNLPDCPLGPAWERSSQRENSRRGLHDLDRLNPAR